MSIPAIPSLYLTCTLVLYTGSMKQSTSDSYHLMTYLTYIVVQT